MIGHTEDGSRRHILVIWLSRTVREIVLSSSRWGLFKITSMALACRIVILKGVSLQHEIRQLRGRDLQHLFGSMVARLC